MVFHSLIMTSTATDVPKILVIEDNIDSRELMARALRIENYSVFIAANGDEALKKIREGEIPALILMDLNMPGIGVDRFMTELKSQPATRNTKVLVVSGDAKIAEKSRAIGAEGYLPKPVDLDKLYFEIDRQLTRSNE